MRDAFRIGRPASLQPIPGHAKVVFAGEVFEVLQWQQQLFDGSAGTFEKVRRNDTVHVLPIINGALRITRQEQPGCTRPFLGLIGGRIDAGEDASDAARRELLEEAGLEPGSLELWTAFQPFAQIDWAVFIFVARECRPATTSNADPGERIELVDVSLEELVRVARHDSFRDVGAALYLLRNVTDPEGFTITQDYLLRNKDRRS